MSKPPSKYMLDFQQTNPELADTMRTHLIHDLDEFEIWIDDFDRFLKCRAESVGKEIKQ